MLGIVLDSKSFQTVVNKISREISDDNKNTREVVIIGIQKGVFLAKRILAEIAKLVGIGKPQIPFDTSRKNIILIDDVLYTGRTERAALDVLMDFGRPKSIQFVVLVDKRGFRELLIEAKYIGIRDQSEELIRIECKENRRSGYGAIFIK